MKGKKSLTVILAILLALGLGLALAACGGEEEATETTVGGTESSAEGTESSTEATEPAEAPAAEGEVYELIVQNHDPATSICGQYLEAWGKKVTEASNGRITFTFYHGGSLGSAAESVEMVENGQADMCWSSQGIYTGMFPVTEGVMLPLNGVTCARMGSAVLMDMLDECPELQQEYEKFHVIQLSTCTYAPLSLTRGPLTTADDFKGLRVRVASKTVGLFMTALGASPMTVATPETYESLEKNVIDGCINDWHNLAAFKLTDLIKSIMDYPINVSPLMIIMNKDSYEELPDDLKAILDQYSGEYASEMAGIYWDSTRAWVVDGAKEAGIEIYEPSQDILDKFDAVKPEVHQSYIDYLNGYGLDGQAIYDKYNEVIARYADEYKDPWADPPVIEDWTK